jgi:CheY-like chemotaxis protein
VSATADPRARKWVLVVDDDPGVRTVMSEQLAMAGYAVVEAGDGQTAVQLLGQIVPHVILLDLEMPRLSGGEFLATLASRALWRRIPVLIVSGNPPDQPPDLPVRIIAMLRKPVSLDVLLARVREALEEQ